MQHLCALFQEPEEMMGFKGARGQPMIFWAVVITLSAAFMFSAVASLYHAPMLSTEECYSGIVLYY